MSRATADDQLKFLLSCVRHSNNGKVDFVQVAAECGVVTRGAAAKRYERLMRANGINLTGYPVERSSTSSRPRKDKSRRSTVAQAGRQRRFETVQYNMGVEGTEEMKSSPPTIDPAMVKSYYNEPSDQHYQYSSQPQLLPGNDQRFQLSGIKNCEATLPQKSLSSQYMVRTQPEQISYFTGHFNSVQSYPSFYQHAPNHNTMKNTYFVPQTPNMNELADMSMALQKPQPQEVVFNSTGQGVHFGKGDQSTTGSRGCIVISD